MKATSSISASSSDKAFGPSASSNAAGGQASDTGFLAMLDGLIQTSGTGSGALGTATPDQGKNSQGDADLADDETVAAASDADDAADLDETTLASSADANAALPATVQPVGQPIILNTAATPAAPQPAAKTTAPGVPVSDDALAAAAIQAGLVPAVPAPAAQLPAKEIPAVQAVAPVSANTAASIPVSAVTALPVTPAAATPAPVIAASNGSAQASVVTQDANQAAAPLPTAPIVQAQAAPSSDAAVAVASETVSAKAQTAPQSDQDNSDTQQSAILSALFAQAPLQVLPQVSLAEPASAKPVSGVSNAGIASVPGVGIPPTLSPQAVVGNGSNSISAHLLASSSDDDDAAPVATPAASHGGDTALSYGIGTSVMASGADSDAAEDDASSSSPAQAPVVASGDQTKADAIAALFTAPAAKTVKADSADAKDGTVAGIASAPAADIASTGITLVHQTSATGAVTASSATGTSAQAYASSPAEQVSLTLQRAANNGPQTMTIALNPIELGKVEVKLDFAKDGSVQASVTADRPETLTLLKNDHTTLTQALHNAGLTTTSSSLSFNLRDGGASQQQQQGFGSASSYRPGSKAVNADGDATASPSSITTVQYAVSSGNGRLDVTV